MTQSKSNILQAENWPGVAICALALVVLAFMATEAISRAGERSLISECLAAGHPPADCKEVSE